MATFTDQVVQASGTYVSGCACRAKHAMRAGDQAPACAACTKPTSWELMVPNVVQRIAPPQRPQEPPR